MLFQKRFVFFKELVEQHRVHLVVSDTVGFPFFVAHYQIGIYFFYFFSDKSELRCSGWINLLFVSKDDRLKLKKPFTGSLHWLDLLFKSLRGGQGSKLT